MTLIKTSVLSAIATVIKIINGFIVTKIVATFVGPAGMGFLGQFQTLITMITTLTSDITSGGVLKYTAEYRDDESEKQKLWSTALRISAVITFLTSLIIILFHRKLSLFIFKTDEYASIFLIFACTLMLFVFNNQLLSILNGQKEIKKLIMVKIASSFVGLGLTGSLAYFFGLYGALLSSAIGQSIVFVVTLSFVLKSEWFKVRLFMQRMDSAYIRKLGKYAAMALTSIFFLSASRMVIRDYLGETISWNDVGYWEGLLRISSTYISLITTALSIYYVPRLSEIKDIGELRREVFDGYKIILPIVIAMALGVYLLRDVAIWLLFTEQFKPMRDLFAFQLLGDVLSITGRMLSMVMFARAMTRKFIYTEVIVAVSFAITSIVFINAFGTVGVTYAYALVNAFYLAMMVWIFKGVLIGGKSL